MNKKKTINLYILPVCIIIFGLVLYFLYVSRIKPILDEELARFAGRAFLGAFIAAAAFFFQRIMLAGFRWYSQNIAIKTETKFDDEFIPLLRRIANITIWIIAGIIILSNFGININALIATLGVSSLAIALAAQDTIANIIAGFLIMIDRPFRIGDEIKLPSGERAKVLDIGVRRSRFLGIDDNSIIIVPNLELGKSKIVNYTYGKERQAKYI